MAKFFTVIFICITILSFAQKQVDLKVDLRDGNSISGSSSLNDINFKTTFGQLLIPIQNVVSISFGIGKDKVISEKAFVYLKVLNSNASDENKKNAYLDLIKLGVKVISAINDFQSDSKNSNELSFTGDYTIDNALAEIQNAFNITDVYKIDDVIYTDNDYVIGGNFDINKIEVKTDYGALTIPKDKIKSMEVSYSLPNSSSEVQLKLNASKNISSNPNGGWLKTGIVLKQGQNFSITANGEVVLASLSNQKYKPDGSSYKYANGGSYDSAAESVSYDEIGNEVNYKALSYGNLVYRIGDSSTELLRAGAKFNGVAKKSGMLYISIYETVYNAANSGSYTVKVKVN